MTALYAELHRRDNVPGDAETKLITCPECGQMEVWTELELSDHGQCRAESVDCGLCSEYDWGE